METINRYLKEDEEIRWLKSYKENLIFIDLFNIGIAIFLFFIAIICIFLINLPFYFSIILSLPFILIGFIDIMKKKKICNVNIKQLLQYEYIFILTNKRWIQKSYMENNMIKMTEFPMNAIEKIHDIVLVNLDYIKTVISIETGEDYIEFRLDECHDLSAPNCKSTHIGLEISFKYRFELIKELSKLIPFEKTKDSSGNVFYNRNEK